MFVRKIAQTSQNWWSWLQKSSNFEEISEINIDSKEPQIDHPVALCWSVVQYSSKIFEIHIFSKKAV